MYVKEGQIKEEEWLSNEHDSEKLDRFLGIIGRRVMLQGYTGWAAGLDTRSKWLHTLMTVESTLMTCISW